MSIFANKELGMGNFIKQQEERKDAKRTWQVKTRQNSRLLFQRFEQVRAKEFTYFAERKKRGIKFNLSQLTFVALVLGTFWLSESKKFTYFAEREKREMKSNHYTYIH